MILALLALAAPVAAADITISPGAGAIQAGINSAASGDTIILSPGTYSENGISITGKSLTIRADTANGHSPADTIVDGLSASPRIFTVTDGSSLTIDNLTLRNGKAANGANGAGVGIPGSPGENGGAISSAGPVTITSSTINGCSAGSGGGGGAVDTSVSPPIAAGAGGNGGSGGAVYSTTAVTVTSSAFINCSAGNGGKGGNNIGEGPIYTGTGGTGGSGGAVYGTTVTVTSSTIAGCSAGNGGTGGTDWNLGGTVGNGGSGGAVYGFTVTVISSVITGCSAGIGGTGGIGGIPGACGTASENGGIGGTGGSGGAVYGVTVTVISSVITRCSAGTGGTGGTNSSSGTSLPGINGAGGNGGSGGAVSGTTVTVTSSTITGCSAGNGGAGTPHYGYAFGGSGGAVSGTAVTVTSSTITGCSVGNTLTESVDGNGSAVSGSGTISFSRLVYNDRDTAVWGSITATDNWWGSDAGPAGHIGGGATAPTWLVLGASATPATIPMGQTSTFRANLTFNSAGSDTSGSGTVPDGTPVTFAASGGSIAPAHAATDSGAATTVFTPSAPGTATIPATVDSQSVTVPVTVTTPAAGINVTSIVVDPSAPANVYAGLDGSGIYRSSNAGSTWTAAATQPANPRIRALAINPAITSRLWAGTYGGGVYRSTDSGASWSACTAPANPYVLSLVRNLSGSLYAGTDDGVFVSSDDCASWIAMNNGMP